jgi:pyrimidine-nucleoside phosphorylase
MRTYELILKKRNGSELSREEFRFLIGGFVRDEIPDYQISAMLMAIYFRGMSAQETANLTMAMVESGGRVDLSRIAGTKVDKHSSGGVGDKTSIVVIPLVASTGVPVPKMSGRGLGHTGGTLDKLESIPGFRTELPMEAFFEQVERVGCAIIGQTANLVPADKKMYALRDVTATVDSVPLIASSIMSKKIAGGADAIVLDVKTGSGAFMKTVPEAEALARAMVEIGRALGRRTVAVISDMDQPLGHAVGNALEVREAIETLRGEGPGDLTELCLELGAQMLRLAGRTSDAEAGRGELRERIRSGEALRNLARMIEAQGGDPGVIEDPGRLPAAPVTVEVTSEAEGYVGRIDAEAIGMAAMTLGAGRAKKDDPIDPAVGVAVIEKVGARIQPGTLLARLYARSEGVAAQVSGRVRAAWRVGTARPERRPLVHRVIE